MNFSQPLGAHFSVAGGLENALYTARELGCDAAQIFTKNARSWKEPELTDAQVHAFKTAREETGVHRVFSHCTYLINIASGDSEKREKSVNALAAEMKRSGKLGLEGVVLHPGAHLGQGVDRGLETARQTLDTVLSRDDGQFPKLLIETTAGTGTSLGSRFEEIGGLIRSLGHTQSVGVCMDTSHVFAAGYDLRSKDALEKLLQAFDTHIGLDKLCLLHLNDSVPELGSRKDRHAHIGKGRIGDAGFKAIIRDSRLATIPKILETPKDNDGIPMDPVNLERLRAMVQGN